MLTLGFQNTLWGGIWTPPKQPWNTEPQEGIIVSQYKDPYETNQDSMVHVMSGKCQRCSGVFMAPVWSLLNVNVNLDGYHIDPSIRRASTFYRAMSARRKNGGTILGGSSRLVTSLRTMVSKSPIPGVVPRPNGLFYGL